MSINLTAPRAARPAAPFGRIVVWLLGLMVLINYIDRGALSTAAPQIREEMGFDAGQMGILLSAFFWTYVPFQPVTVWLAEKINTYRVLALSLVVWAAATALTGIAHGFMALLALRLVLGVGESAAFPCSSKLFGLHLPAARMGFASALLGVGIGVGPAFGTFVGGNIIAEQGWRMSFVLFGLLSLVWLIPWLFATRNLSRDATAAVHAEDPAPFPEMMSKLRLWGSTFGHHFGLYGFYFMVTWLPSYLEKAQGFTVVQMATTAGEIWLTFAAANIIAGVISDRLIKSGVSITWARKPFLVGGPLLVCAALLACAFGDRQVALAGLFVGMFGMGVQTPNIYASAQSMGGPRGAGRWVGFMNAIGNIAGIIAPIVTGFIVKETGSFYSAFIAAGAAAVLCALCWGLLVWRIDEVEWVQRRRRRVA
jgi:MFS family permease